MTGAVKSMLTLLNRPEDMGAILDWAKRLATDFEAVADAVFLKYDLSADSAILADGFGFYASDAAAREIEEASAQAEKVAREAFARAADEAPRLFGDLHVIPDGLRGGLARFTRHYDLAVAHLPEGATLIAGETLLAELLLQGGSPVFVAPRGAPGTAPLDKALVAWDASLEASRALRAALGLVKRCRSVRLCSIAEKGARAIDPDSAARYLRRHGIEAETAVLPPGDRGAGAAILEEAERAGADFIVMGAFRHSPWREQLFGGATHVVLRGAKKPLLMAH
ncbi:universal stress protein [Amphiplicatus metriothermophilus]|uniref:Universal stress protein family protein n=1 Tax=Amphiplicatus metriothermophilus TaxID=1519374 RepID=A0A239PL86_9PROT|nr:universal stress protein [Amphiplicatus metriothermophilus]MBB5517339.1 nucleotide-binding universal stress UspA family protein [Amphiplicatus metriothermophilus]SNT68325.1 Universal stress protein family protein [Amphiplicatus metriothermophilus]